MNASQNYTVIAIATLTAVALILYRRGWRRKKNTITPLAGLAFGFILAGIVFNEGRLVPYSLMGVGVVLALADMINHMRRKSPDNSSG